MLAIQLPVSLLQTSKHPARTMKEPLPPLPHFAEFQQGRASERWGTPGREARHTPFEFRSGNTATIRHGLRTPPTEMHEMNVNPLLIPSFGPLQYKGVPVVAPNTTANQNNLNSTGSLRYTSRVPPMLDTCQPVKASQSPQLSNDQSASRGQAHRRHSSEGTDIVHYLQIPRSINDSKGSLSEFAAQVSLVPLAKSVSVGL